MNLIISIVIVMGSVLGGFAMVNGPFHVLVQPSEFVVICGALLGALIGYAPLPVFFQILKTIPKAYKGSGINKTTYLQLLGLMFVLFNAVRKEGALGIEADLNDPHNSEKFKKFPGISHNHHAMDMIVGSMRLFIDGVVNAFELDNLMEKEIETHSHEAARIPALLGKAADAAPGIGIVAAVLGIIVTMQHLDGPPAEIGHHVAAALVGTFLGILLAYGIMQPIVATIEGLDHDMHVLLNSIRSGIAAFAGGAPPQVALEFARKSIDSLYRPSDKEMEELQNELKKK